MIKLVGYSVFCNLYFIIAMFYFGLGRPIVNLDYLLLLGIFLFPHSKIRSTLLFISLLSIYLIDLLLQILQVFPFVRLTDLFYLSGFIFNGPILYRLILLLSIIIFFVIFFIIRDYFYKTINLNLKKIILIIFSILLTLFTKHLIHPLEKDRPYNQIERELVGSQLLFFIKFRQSSFIEAIGGDTTKLQPSPYKNATHPLFEQIKEHRLLSQKILLIVNESWGETNKPEHQQKILEPIYQKVNKLDFIQQGSFNFIGATVAGELRELCNKQPTNFNLKDSQKNEFKNCLPNQLKNLGYTTSANHGAMSILYDRSSWYPKAGFQHLYFFEQLSNSGNCKAFSGRCDVRIFPEIKKQLLASDKSFVYWMTLNTHAPYDDTVFLKGLDCRALKVKVDSETCHNYELQYQFFQNLAKLIDDPRMQGLEVYIAGDHSPPIFNLSDNFFSFKGSDIAWVRFKVKNAK